MTSGDADEILGGERRLDEDFGERHAAPRNVVIAFGASRIRVVQENHVPGFGRVFLPLTNLAGVPQTGTKHRSRNSCSAGIRSSNFTPSGVLALLTQTIVGITLRLKSATTTSRLVDILHCPPIVQRCMRGDIEGTRSRLQPRAVAMLRRLPEFHGPLFPPAFALCRFFLADYRIPRLASIWSMASTTASKVSSVEACRALYPRTAS